MICRHMGGHRETCNACYLLVEDENRVLLDKVERMEQEAVQYDVVYRRLPWLGDKGGVLYAIYGSSSVSYADELEKELVRLRGIIDRLTEARPSGLPYGFGLIHRG